MGSLIFSTAYRVIFIATLVLFIFAPGLKDLASNLPEEVLSVSGDFPEDIATPIQAVLSIDHFPPPGESATLVCEISSVLDAPDTSATIELPPEASLISGDIMWRGDLLADEVVQIVATVVFETQGDVAIFCRALKVVDESEVWGDLAEMYLSIGGLESQPGFSPVPQEARDMIGQVEVLGEGQVISEAPTQPGVIGDAQSVPEPGGVDPSLEWQMGSEPEAPLGDLTITGRWRFYNRNDILDSEQFLVEIVRGDNSAHLAWCYTNVNGYYTCGPFANPGGAGVRSRLISYTKFNPYNDILITVNPDWGTSNSVDNAYGTTTSIQVFSDGTHDIGSWYVVNGANYERAYWIVKDLILGWKYVFFGTGSSQSPVETPGPSTVEWKIDSTDGAYYSRGGNIHLTGADPLSNTVVNHEYGHNMMWTVYGSWMPTTYCPSPHYVQLNSHVNCAWTEGWANFFAIAVNNDPVYRWASGSSLNLENPTWGTPSWDQGDDVEGRVAGALWDILDNNNEGDDQYSDEGIANIWDTLYHQNDNNFSEYWSAWKSRSHDNSSAGPVMSIYQNTIDYRGGPSNDDFANAAIVSGPGYAVTSLNTVNATTQGNDPTTSCGSSSTPKQSRSVWYRFTPSVTHEYVINTFDSNYDTVLAVWTGSFGSLTERGCSDDSGGLQSEVILTLNAGTTYYIEAMRYGSSSGGLLNLSVNTWCSPPGIPVLVSPPNSSNTNDSTPTFDWNSSSHSAQYHIQVDNSSDFSSPAVNVLIGTTGYTPGSLADSVYYWRVRGRNFSAYCNLYGSWSSQWSIRVDTLSPTGSIVINSGATYSSSTSVSLSLSASDSGSGVYQMRFSNNGSSWSGWEVYGSSKSWTVTSGDGTKAVYVQYRDYAGNFSTYNDTIILDTTGPSGSISINGGAAYTASTAASLSQSASDSGSGVAQMRFSNDGSSWSGWEAYSSSKSWALSSGDGSKTVYVQFRDNVGNDSTYNDSIILDTLGPSGSITINGGDTYATSIAVELNLSASDSGSGVAQMRFSNDGSSWSGWEAYATTKNWDLSSGEGAKTVYVQYRDSLGNVSSQNNDVIILDTILPTGSIVINSGETYATSTSAVLSLSASDSGSGVYQMRFSNDGSSWSGWESYGISENWSLSSGDGTKTVYVQYKDNAGNVSTAYNDTIILDTAPPTGSIAVNGGVAFVNTTSVILNLSASDAGSGVGQMRLSSDGSSWDSWESFAASKSWTLQTGDGVKTVHVQYKDNLGNLSSIYSDDVILDTSLPTGSILINSGATYATSAATNLTLSASDTGSGVSQMRFSNDGSSWSNWESFDTTRTWNLSSGDGSKIVLVQYSDLAGNLSAYNDSIILDTTPPSTSAASPAFTVLTSFTVTWSGSDQISGIASFDVQFKVGSGGAWTTWFSGTTATSEIFGPTVPGSSTPVQLGESYYFRVRARDYAGNLESYPVNEDSKTTISRVVFLPLTIK